MENMYHKIELHTTSDILKEHETIDYEKKAVEKIMKDHNLDYALEFEERTYNGKVVEYALNLIIRKQDLDYVIKLLDEAGGFGYYVDLEQKNKSIKENSDEDYEDDIIVEKNKIENIDPIRNLSDNEIVDDLSGITEEDRKEKYNIEINNFAKAYLTIVFSFLTICEIWGIKYFYDKKDFEAIMNMILLIICEMPIFILMLKVFYKKKGE